MNEIIIHNIHTVSQILAIVLPFAILILFLIALFNIDSGDYRGDLATYIKTSLIFTTSLFLLALIGFIFTY